MTVGERIAKCRKNKNLSQEYVADQLGISRQSVSKWEKNITYPDTNNLIALAELLGTNVEYIACGKEPTADGATISTVTNKPSNLYKIVGIVLLLAGLVCLVLGFTVKNIEGLVIVGGMFISFGVMFVCWEKLGLLISLALILLTAILSLTVGVDDIDIAQVILACSCYASLLAALVAVVISIFRKKK